MLVENVVAAGAATIARAVGTAPGMGVAGEGKRETSVVTADEDKGWLLLTGMGVTGEGKRETSVLTADGKRGWLLLTTNRGPCGSTEAGATPDPLTAEPSTAGAAGGADGLVSESGRFRSAAARYRRTVPAEKVGYITEFGLALCPSPRA